MIHTRMGFAGSFTLLCAWVAAGCASASAPSPDETGSESTSSDSLRMCRSNSDCPQIRMPCRLCPDGVNSSCAASICERGQCLIRWSPCPGLIQCGGFAGLPCPAGFDCVDDPRDDCSPCRGGADCGGICVELSCKPECDPTLICGQAVTCVDGQLYPTTCGPKNCDKPLGPCN
ncbi:MAG TPA: hypothetical protein VK524_26520 [Polyangiaceae bacterium]|nr:hypothetical protein [Polyangiaceae bacterium]